MTSPADHVAAGRIGEVAADASEDAGGLDPALLGDFIAATDRAAATGRRLNRAALAHYRDRGAEAARRGVALRGLVDLYLSAAWRLWRHLPAVAQASRDPQGVVRAGEAVLRAADDAVAAVTEGFQLARRNLVRAEEAARRELVDDLLLGRADAEGLVQRAAAFGLDLSGPHAVALVRAEQPFAEGGAVMAAVERSVLGRKGDAGVLVATKDGLLVVAFAAPDRAAVGYVLGRLGSLLGPPPDEGGGIELHRRADVGRWRLAASRGRAGATGIRASYEEARTTLELADRLDLPSPVADAADLLVYRVLLRDRAAMTDLVTSLLTPLQEARGGALPLLQTLRAYFDAGGNTARAARALHLSVRAVTYRLARVASLTGYDPADPEQRFALETAVLGARLLDWPPGVAA